MVLTHFTKSLATGLCSFILHLTARPLASSHGHSRYTDIEHTSYRKLLIIRRRPSYHWWFTTLLSCIASHAKFSYPSAEIVSPEVLYRISGALSSLILRTALRLCRSCCAVIIRQIFVLIFAMEYDIWLRFWSPMIASKFKINISRPSSAASYRLASMWWWILILAFDY